MKTIILLIFLSSFSLNAKWEYFSPSIANWNYMPNHNNAYIDTKGNIWFHSDGDIFKYNGNNWKKFAFNQSGIKDGINCISEDKNGNIWVGTDYNEDLNNDKIFRIEGDSLIPFKIGKTSSDIYFEDVKGIFFDVKNELWVVSEDGIYQYNEQSKFWTRNLADTLQSVDEHIYGPKFDNNIENVIIYNNNSFLIFIGYKDFTPVFGFYKFEINKDKLILQYIKKPYDKHSSFKFVNIDSNKIIWSWNELGQVYLEENEWKRMEYQDTTFIKIIGLCCIDEFNNKYYSQFIEYNEDKYINNKYYLYNNIGFKFLFEQKNLQEDFEKSLNRNDILLYKMAFKDISGNYWFSLFNDRGIAKYTPEGASVKDKISITLFPNPAQNNITINSEEQIKSLGLYSLNLSKISDFTPNHTTTQELDISNLASGVYFIKVNDDFIKFVRE